MSTKAKARTALFKKPVVADEVKLCAMRLGQAILARVGLFFEEYGLTTPQFNALRILYVRDPENEGLPIGTVGAGLVVRGPDVTRLVDRLEKAGLLQRIRPEGDRRVVKLVLTRAGTALVEKAHEPLVQQSRDLFAHMSEAELKQLGRGLRRALEGFK
jgi:DNA-binding MarR family transcriptional regulator